MIARLLSGRLAGYFDRPGLLAISSGAMIALSFPNPGLSFLAWVALVPLLIALEESPPRVAFRLGLTCGITAYAVILYWINIVIDPLRASSLVGQHPAVSAAGTLVGHVLRPERLMARVGE